MPANSQLNEFTCVDSQLPAASLIDEAGLQDLQREICAFSELQEANGELLIAWQSHSPC